MSLCVSSCSSCESREEKKKKGKDNKATLLAWQLCPTRNAYGLQGQERNQQICDSQVAVIFPSLAIK